MAQKGSKKRKKAQKGSKRRSKRLFEPARCRQCARRGCSSLLRCRLCVRRGCSSLLFKITVRKGWTRLHCALRLFALLSLLRACMQVRSEHDSSSVRVRSRPTGSFRKNYARSKVAALQAIVHSFNPECVHKRAPSTKGRGVKDQ